MFSHCKNNQIPADQMRPCVIFMHGNLENKFIGQNDFAKHCIAIDCDFISFDFSGCGNSDGEFVTLGLNERNDLDCILTYLVKEQRTSKVVLWAGG